MRTTTTRATRRRHTPEDLRALMENWRAALATVGLTPEEVHTLSVSGRIVVGHRLRGQGLPNLRVLTERYGVPSSAVSRHLAQIAPGEPSRAGVRVVAAAGCAGKRTGRLTRRQSDVLWWAAHGDSDAEIGARLGVGRRTVKFHMFSALQRLGARNRTHAVVLALIRDELRLTERTEGRTGDDRLGGVGAGVPPSGARAAG